MLTECRRPLVEEHDLVVLDLDGVVYVDGHAVGHAAPALTEAAQRGTRLAYVTNNASRTPEQVAAKLSGLGMPVDVADVVTSAQAAAQLLRELLDADEQVFVIGGTGLHEALSAVGLVPVTTPGPDVRAVAQGYGPEMPWKQVVDGAILVREGLHWVASNTDLTIPTARGVGPGNGTLVRLVAQYADREPVVAGKPETPLLAQTLARAGGTRPVMVGDRLDTDIEGANRIGWPSLLVLTGVTGLDELVQAPPHERPTYLGQDLRALHRPHPVPSRDAHGAWCDGGWSGIVEDDQIRVHGEGTAEDWWRVVAATAWGHLDAHGSVAGTARLREPR